MRISTQLQPAYLLHQRPYRDTSLLLEIFTPEQGRFGLVARGARAPKSRNRGLLQLFQPLLLSWTGRAELGTLTGVEPNGTAPRLLGATLYSGFYLNELIMRLLQRLDPHPELFMAYAEALQGLQYATERPLRLFEKRLLETLGYGLMLDHEADTGEPVIAEGFYRYELETGPVAVTQGSVQRPGQGLCLQGSSLLSLAADQLEDAQSLSDCKRLMRAALGLYLGDRKLKTREVFAAMAAR
ncbi:MAG: DNA repair protein RecO [Gammaproteobacteria bacterium]|nr:DNA repair protein RecO [Gammaproteobacteria bacterium]MBU2478698.1 DNA repair protein RecO [Gammaproteobacteria bacterium]